MRRDDRSRRGALALQLEDELEAVFLIDGLAGLLETEVPNECERGNVVGRRARNEAADAAFLRHAQELGRSRGRVAPPTPGLLDRVADLDRIRFPLRIDPRRPVIARVPDHLAVEDDRMRAPQKEPRVLAHLPEAELEEAHPALAREPLGKLGVKSPGRLLAVALEERLEELGSHRPELDQSQGSPRCGSRSSKEASASSSSLSNRSEKSARTLATCVVRASSSFFFPFGVRTAYITRASSAQGLLATNPASSSPFRSRVIPEGVNSTCSTSSTRLSACSGARDSCARTSKSLIVSPCVASSSALNCRVTAAWARRKLIHASSSMS